MHIANSQSHTHTRTYARAHTFADSDFWLALRQLYEPHQNTITIQFLRLILLAKTKNSCKKDDIFEKKTMVFNLENCQLENSSKQTYNRALIIVIINDEGKTFYFRFVDWQNEKIWSKMRMESLKKLEINNWQTISSTHFHRLHDDDGKGITEGQQIINKWKQKETK